MISKSLCNPLPLNLCNPGGGIFQVPSLVHSSPSTLFRGPVFQAVRAVFWVACVALRPSQGTRQGSGMLRFLEIPFGFSGPQACVLSRCRVGRDFLGSFAAVLHPRVSLGSLWDSFSIPVTRSSQLG